jgi:ribosomal protein S18 acetylase RimI-like enzyme
LSDSGGFRPKHVPTTDFTLAAAILLRLPSLQRDQHANESLAPAEWIERFPNHRPERALRVGRLQQRRHITIRPINQRRFRQEVALLLEIYNSAWERNWGFVPVTTAEVESLAKQLRWIGNPNLCLIAEKEGKPVGFALALPDYNQALRHLDGRLFPFGWLKLLWYQRKINAARVLTLGLKPGFRHMGIDAMLYLRLWEEAPKNGYQIVECSWILEDNWPMRRGLERMGARLYKTYRIYEKTL